MSSERIHSDTQGGAGQLDLSVPPSYLRLQTLAILRRTGCSMHVQGIRSDHEPIVSSGLHQSIPPACAVR